MEAGMNQPHVTHPPGSKKAQKAGCTCPVIDNNRGKGYGGNVGVYVMNWGCPLHGRLVRGERKK